MTTAPTTSVIRSPSPSRKLSNPTMTTTPTTSVIRSPSPSRKLSNPTMTTAPTTSVIRSPSPSRKLSNHTMTTSPKPTSTVASKLSASTVCKPSRSSTPTSMPTLPSSKPIVKPRSASPSSRPTTRSSTPTSRSTLPAPKTTPGATEYPSSSSSNAKLVPSSATNPVPSCANSPTLKSKPENPLKISCNGTLSANRGRIGPPSLRSSLVEPVSNGRVRRQSCSPAKGRSPNGMVHTNGSSVPALSRLHAKANDNVSPVLLGTMMVERVMNMRKLAPPKLEHSARGNFSGKSSSPDSSGFGRLFSKNSFDMAIRHMDIRRCIPGMLRPLMANIPATSMYSTRSVNKSEVKDMSSDVAGGSSAVYMVSDGSLDI